MINRIQFAILCGLCLTVSTVALAETREQDAVTAGRVIGGFNYARFRCLAAGIPMPTLEDRNPGMSEFYDAMKSKYPEFVALGNAEGVKRAKSLLSGSPKDFSVGCELYKRK